MNLWPFNRKSREQALVEFAGFHVLCDVQRDADDRPFVMICRTAIRLDDPAVIEQRNVIWIKRRADEPPADKGQSVTKKPHLGEVGYVFRDVGSVSPEESAPRVGDPCPAVENERLRECIVRTDVLTLRTFYLDYGAFGGEPDEYSPGGKQS